MTMANGRTHVQSLARVGVDVPDFHFDRIKQWFLARDDEGREQTLRIALTYQSMSEDTEGRPGNVADTWAVATELEPHARRARYEEIAEAAWKLARDQADASQVTQIFKVIALGAGDLQLSHWRFVLNPQIGRAISSDALEAPTTQGGRAFEQRWFNTGLQIVFGAAATNYAQLSAEHQRSLDRISQLEAKLISALDSREEALDRKAERELKLREHEQMVRFGDELFGLVKKVIPAVVAKHWPDERLRNFIESLDKDQLVAFGSGLNEKQRAELVTIIRGYAEQKEAEKRAAEEKAAKAAAKEAAAKK